MILAKIPYNFET